jgi:hypothetical protein
MLLLVAILLKTLRLSLLFLSAGDGESGTTGAAEGMRRIGELAAQSGDSMQDLINNSISPFYIKKEIIEQEENNMDTAEQGGPELVGVCLPSFQNTAGDSSRGSEDEGSPGRVIQELFAEGGKTVPSGTERPPVLPRIDHRYHVVRGLRSKDRTGMDLNKEGVVPLSNRVGFQVQGDDRFALIENVFKVDKGRNVSRSFDTTGRICETCPAAHDAFQGKDDLPVVFALSDQHFSPCLPARDQKDCIRVCRVEDGYLREIVGEFVSGVGKRRLVPGSVVLLGSLTHLERDGTAKYAEEWKQCRNWIQSDLGGIMVLPLIPMPMEDISDRATIRSLIEFLSWFDCLPEAEVKLLSDTRKQFVSRLLARTGTGRGWCDGRQTFTMPVDLSSFNSVTFNSRLWGNRPRKVNAFTVEDERLWAGMLAGELNRDFSLNLSEDLGIFRSASEIRKMGEGTNKVKIVVGGGSNASKLATALKNQGIVVDSLAVPGWRLTPDNVKKLIDSISAAEEGSVFVLYGIGNSCFVSVDDDMRSGPPFRGRDGKFHSHGTLEVVSGFLLDRILTLLKDVVSSCNGRFLVIVTPMPRYWIPCCPKGKQLDEAGSDSDKRRLLRELSRLRAAISGMVARLRRTDNVQVINPLESLGLHDDLQAIEQVMIGPTHLVTASYKVLADSIVKKVLAVKQGKRRGERHPSASSNSKRGRFDAGYRYGNRSGPAN